MSGEARAIEPEDVTRLVAERLNAGDAAGAADGAPLGGRDPGHRRLSGAAGARRHGRGNGFPPEKRHAPPASSRFTRLASSAPENQLSIGEAALLAGGVFVVETVFAWPGVGRLAMTAILQRDYPVVQGCVLLVAVAFVLVNLFVDVLYGWLDPRIRYE